MQQEDGLEGLEQIYASAHVGLAVLDADLRFSRVNQWLAQMHGIPIAAHIGHGLREICPDRAEQSEALLYRVIRTGEPALECEVRCGKHIFVEHYVPLRDRAGAVVGINIAVEDVSRLKQIEAELRDMRSRLEAEVEERNIALRQSELRLKQAAEVGRMKAFEWDPATDEVKHSGKIEAMSRPGMTVASEHETGQWFFAHIHPEDRERFLDNIYNLTPAQDAYHIEYRFLPPGGGVRWLEESGRGFFDGRGKLIRLVGMTADISARKEAEQEVRKHSEAAIHTGRLNAMGELTSTLAHELNQPLMAIDHFIYAAQRLTEKQDCDRNELKHLLAVSREQVKRSSKVIQHLREFARHGKLRKESLAVSALVDGALGLVNPLLMDEQVAVHAGYAEDLPLICVDPLHVEQVLINLLRNSIDALRQVNGERRRIDILASLVDEGVKLTVQDNGAGMDQAMLEKIFQAFETSKTDGMGIGLAISRSIVEAHGGRIWAETPPTRGALFHIVLPGS
ncbi:hypothetical protein Tel_13150 [Candidatus Tenderia electrophaga]|uniref:histidine kinase n=1 Tax=Candidatus Tenderia electrophaga TaxID=1748243 RepID=A0A0S2TFW8_9GAMM|nr:hypothetical protein Tel_13150 [Candidatus Tenderia electrophaga]